MQYSNTVKSVVSVSVLGLLMLGLASTSVVAQASPATTTFGVSATVLKDCVVTASAMQFGNYTGAVDTPTSTITVTCTNTTTYTVSLNKGTTTGSAVNARLMAGSGGATLAYALYSNSTMTTLWGDGTSGTSTVGGTGSGIAQPLPVYGQIAAGLYVTPGSYTDTITATVTY